MELSKINTEPLLAEILAYAKRYQILLNGNSGSAALDACIDRLNRLETTVTRLYFLEVLRLYNENKLTLAQVTEIFLTTENYLFRRTMCDLPTNALNKIFLILHRENIRYDGIEDKAIITKLAMSEEENIALHFNTNLDAFTKSLEIGDGIYVWTNTSTQSKLSVLSRLFKLYDEDPADLVFYLRDENKANADEPGSRHELRRKYWTYALPIIQKAHDEDGSFSNVNPSRDNWINGFFGIGGFYLCCVVNYDAARVEVVLGRGNK